MLVLLPKLKIRQKTIVSSYCVLLRQVVSPKKSVLEYKIVLSDVFEYRIVLSNVFKYMIVLSDVLEYKIVLRDAIKIINYI